MKKILVLTDSIEVNDSSGAKANVALIKNLKRAGIGVKVLHYTRRNISLQGIDCVSVPERKFTLNYLLGKSLLISQRLTKLPVVQFLEKRMGFSFLFFNDSQSIKKALEEEDLRQYDWIMTLSKGASFRPHHAVLKVPKWHDKWLAYIHDPFPFHYYPEPYDWFMPGYKQKEEFFIKVANNVRYVVFPSLLLQEWMEKWYPAMKGKGIIIPHQISPKVAGKKQITPYFLKHGFTLLHAGSLLKQRPPQALVKGFELFLKRIPEATSEVQLLLVGSASYHKDFLDRSAAAIPQLYVSKGYVEYTEVQSLQEYASVNIILEADDDVSPFLPGKFPHCVVANAPILLIGPKNSETCRLLGKTYPWQTENKNPENISKLIEELYIHWKTATESFRLNRNDLENYMGHHHLSNTIDNLIH